MKIRYVGPLAGPLDVPAFGLYEIDVSKGEPIDVTDDQGVQLCEQVGNWEPADDESAAVLKQFCAWVDLFDKVLDVEGDHGAPYEYVLIPKPAADSTAADDDGAAPKPAGRRQRATATTTETSPADAGDEGAQP